LSNLPWWLLILLLAGVVLAFRFATDATYGAIFRTLALGLPVTIAVTALAYAAALVIGLVAGLGRLSGNVVVYTLATLYVQVIRGVPILVQMFVAAFVLVPLVVQAINGIGALLVDVIGWGDALADFQNRDVAMVFRASFALAVAYGGYEAETFRAGIQSIGQGQRDAARSLGMTYFQLLRFIVLPQAVRRVLPTLGNDFIAMLKDSSLVSVLGVRDMTQQARLFTAATFIYPPTLLSLAFMYLTLTLVLAMGVKVLEERMGYRE